MMSSLANDNHTCIFVVMSLSHGFIVSSSLKLTVNVLRASPHCKANFNLSGKDLIL